MIKFLAITIIGIALLVFLIYILKESKNTPELKKPIRS